MIKNQTVLELKGGSERIYKFVCENDSPLGEIHDILCQMRGFIVQRINEANKIAEEESQSCEECKEE